MGLFAWMYFGFRGYFFMMCKLNPISRFYAYHDSYFFLVAPFSEFLHLDITVLRIFLYLFNFCP